MYLSAYEHEHNAIHIYANHKLHSEGYVSLVSLCRSVRKSLSKSTEINARNLLNSPIRYSRKTPMYLFAFTR